MRAGGELACERRRFVIDRRALFGDRDELFNARHRPSGERPELFGESWR